MGRTHSNAYRQVSQFFDLKYRPVLKTVCGRSEENARAFAENWGYESFETDWRKLIDRKDIDAIDICTPNDTHAEIAIAAAEAGKMVLCEKPLARTLKEAHPMVEAVEKAGVPNTVLVQLPPRAGGDAGQATDRRGPARQDLPLPGQLPAGLDHLGRPAAGRRRALAARRAGRGLGRHRRPAGPLHRHRALAQWLDRQRVLDDRDVHQGAQA